MISLITAKVFFNRNKLRTYTLIKFDLLNTVVIVSLALLGLYSLNPAYQSFKLRDFIAESLVDSEKAKIVVATNFAEGNPLNNGWSPLLTSSGVIIDIAPLTGVITLTFPQQIDGENRTLVLIPIYQNSEGYISLSYNAKTLRPIQKPMITWLCTSSLTSSNNAFIKNNTGTLQGKYAPANCRHVPLKYKDLK